MKAEMLQTYMMPTPLRWRSTRRVKILTLLCAVYCLHLLVRTLNDPHGPSLEPPWGFGFRQDGGPERESFQPLPIAGFVNSGNLENRACEDLRVEGELQVQKSWYLEDDLERIAESLDDHDMIDYSNQREDLTYEELVEKTWARLSGSSVWLERFQVFLTVTRVIFYDKGVKHWPVISFLAGQLHDANWQELKNHTIEWQGQEIRFPTVFNIPAPTQPGGAYFGPEDPRVILEEGVDDAEPIVVFNMVHDLNTFTRAMHIFRPFSNSTTLLSITGQWERPLVEKNWAPFFINEHEAIAPGRHRWPSHYIHFIYNFSPLTVLKCHALNGWCDLVYEQEIPHELWRPGIDGDGRMSGGTNLVPLQVGPTTGLQAWIAFPRTHINIGCSHEGLALYRPELMIMSVHDSKFYLNFMSGPIDFGAAALTAEALDDPCGQGEVLIANSIAKWDRRPKHDILTLTLSVADSTVQVLQLAGVSRFIGQLPVPEGAFHPGDDTHGNDTDGHVRFMVLGQDVLDCTMEAASYYSEIIAAPYEGKPKEDLLNGHDDDLDGASQTGVPVIWPWGGAWQWSGDGIGASGTAEGVEGGVKEKTEEVDDSDLALDVDPDVLVQEDQWRIEDQALDWQLAILGKEYQVPPG